MPDKKKNWEDIAKCGDPISRPDPHEDIFVVDKRRDVIIKGYICDLVGCITTILNKEFEKIKKIAEIIISAHDKGKQVITMGNGGSAAVASHMASDFSKAWLGDRLFRLRTTSLVDNVSQMTAWANDAGYDKMFVGPLQTLLEEGDVVIGISASGNSKNILDAIELANKRGAVTIGLTGFDGGKLKKMAGISFIVPSKSFKIIEDIHGIIAHLIKAVVVNEVRDRIKKAKRK